MTSEQEAIQTIRFISGFNEANTNMSKEAVNYWLKNYSDTVFVRGHLRKVVFTPITPEFYNIKTEEIK